jgi:hypothetical protein
MLRMDISRSVLPSFRYGIPFRDLPSAVKPPRDMAAAEAADSLINFRRETFITFSLYA